MTAVDTTGFTDQDYLTTFRAVVGRGPPTAQSTAHPTTMPADVRIYQVAYTKDYKISTVLRQFEELAVDCPLQYARNRFPDYLNYTSTCYYQPCQYRCQSGTQLPDETIVVNWLRNGDPHVDESTFRSYYLGEELERIEQYLAVLLRERIQQGEFYATTIALYHQLSERFPELKHQVIGYPYLLMALAAMVRRQYRIQSGAGQAYYLQFEGDLVYLTLHLGHTNVVGTGGATVADITTAMFRDITVQVPVSEQLGPLFDEYHQRLFPRLLAEYRRARATDTANKDGVKTKVRAFIYALRGVIKAKLYEYVYDRPDEESQQLRRDFEVLLPDRFMRLPYLANAMTTYYQVLTSLIRRAGRPPVSGRQQFTVKMLESALPDTELVDVHILNYPVNVKFNIIANVIHVKDAKFRLRRNGQWESPHAPGTTVNMDVVYQTYLTRARIQAQQDLMRRALGVSGGTYGYHIQQGASYHFYVAHITQGEYEALVRAAGGRSTQTGAPRNTEKGSRYKGQYDRQRLAVVQAAYRRQFPNEPTTPDLPEMLTKLNLTLSFSYDTQ